MRIRVYRNLAKPFPPLTEGWEGDVEDNIGRRIVDARLGCDVTPPKPEAVKTTPKRAEFTTAPMADATPLKTSEPDDFHRNPKPKLTEKMEI